VTTKLQLINIIIIIYPVYNLHHIPLYSILMLSLHIPLCLPSDFLSF